MNWLEFLHRLHHHNFVLKAFRKLFSGNFPWHVRVLPSNPESVCGIWDGRKIPPEIENLSLNRSLKVFPGFFLPNPAISLWKWKNTQIPCLHSIKNWLFLISPCCSIIFLREGKFSIPRKPRKWAENWKNKLSFIAFDWAPCQRPCGFCGFQAIWCLRGR